MNKVLFLVNKWGNIGDPNSPNPDHDFGGLISSFQDAGLAEYDVVYYDDYMYQVGVRVDTRLYEQVATNKYDAVIALLVHWMPSLPRLQTLEAIAKICPIAYIWYDVVGKGEQDLCRKLEHTARVNVFMDTKRYPNIAAETILHLWFPRDSRMYFGDPAAERDIDVSWLGSVANYGERGFYLQALKDAGVNVWMPDKRLSNAECCEIWRRSKMSLNFSGGVEPGKRQFKTRIMEVTLCGALLLESDNDEIEHWFDPGIDYVAFKNPQDLIDKIKFYTEDHETRLRTANSGWERATRAYNGKEYWRTVLEKF